MMFTGVTIVSSPAGTPVSRSNNTFDYPILSSVTLTCMVNPTPSSSVTYQWNTAGCYTNSKFTGSNPQCFPHSQTTQNVTGNNLNAEDAGTITCTVTISGSDYTSELFTLRISGEQLVYCVIACIVYCKQCMILLLATCYCCIIHQLLWFMYRGVFTVGVAVTDARQNSNLNSANELTDYSYINARGNNPNGALLARCLTGLGPTESSSGANGLLGGLYFNGNMIPNSGESASCSSDVIEVRPGGSIAGVTNFHQCDRFSADVEGIYTCALINSANVTESVRFGVYFIGRSESLDFYIPSLNHLSSLYTDAPMIDTPSSSTVIVNAPLSLTLNCTSRGSPPDTFTWQREGNSTVLQSTNITAVDHSRISAVFRATYFIASVTARDSGIYTCTVTNPIGSANATITVDVIGNVICTC